MIFESSTHGEYPKYSTFFVGELLVKRASSHDNFNNYPMWELSPLYGESMEM